VGERLHVDDIDGDGNPEVLVDQSTINPVRRSLLTCLNRDGSLRWEFEYGRRKLWKGREFSLLYQAELVRVLKKREQSYIMVVGIHVPYFPSQVAFLDPRTGVAVGEYWHPGHLNVSSLVDLDGDGLEEILLGGVNNPGPGLGYPAIAVLPSPFLPGGPIGRSPSIDSWGGDERAYVLLPRSDVAECRQQLTVVSQFLVPEPGMIEVSVTGGEGRNPFDSWGGYYRLNFALRLLDFRPGEWMGSTHAKLQRDGQLDHPFGEAEMDALRRILYFNRAPDGNGSEVERLRVLSVQQQIADNETRGGTRPPASPE